MLQEADKPVTGFSEVVSWLADGKAFRIHDETAFVNTTMKMFFKQSKFKSFTRQLYIYGFLRVLSGLTSLTDSRGAMANKLVITEPTNKPSSIALQEIDRFTS